jgi:hypothetical protein
MALSSYTLASVGSWFSFLYIVYIHAGRIVEGKTLSVFAIYISLAAFLITLPFYCVALRGISGSYFHLIYWSPLLMTVLLYWIFGISFAP